MFSKTTLFLAFVAVTRFATAAGAPPACFLAAINTQQTLNDYEAICGDGASEVQGHIQDLCKGNNVKTALDHFASACKEKGHTVASVTSSASASVTASRTGRASSSGSATASATASLSSNGTNSGSGGNYGYGNNATVTGGGAGPTGLTTFAGTAQATGTGAGGAGASATTSSILTVGTGAAAAFGWDKGAALGAVVLGLAALL